jgi:hypothetical protein
MSNAAMRKWIEEASRRPRARLTGVVYLLYFLTAIPAELLASRGLVVYGNAANLVAFAFYIVVTLLFYDMFRPVNRGVSLLAALFSLGGCAIGVLGLFHLASNISPLIFFGPYCLLIGYLILRATFLPRFFGVLMVLAGLGWLVFLLPQLADQLSLYVEVLGVVAEASLMLWLVVFGVNVRRWNECDAAALRAR